MRAARARRSALMTKLAGDRMIAALDRLGEVLRKEFDPDQPRIPAGSPEGGQWARASGTGTENDPILLPPIIVSPASGIGHNGGPSLEEPPTIPEEPPPGKGSVLRIAKDVARWLARFISRRVLAVVAALAAIERAVWLREEQHSIRSYRDPPKTLQELIDGAHTARPGYHRHHIVEQGPARAERFPSSMIDGRNNVVSVPIYKHREITAWYQKPNPRFGGKSPREHLRGKSWEERTNVGLHALRLFEVLK